MALLARDPQIFSNPPQLPTSVFCSSQVDVQTWILALGGVGIVCGIAFFSSNISRCLGVQVPLNASPDYAC